MITVDLLIGEEEYLGNELSVRLIRNFLFEKFSLAGTQSLTDGIFHLELRDREQV